MSNDEIRETPAPRWLALLPFVAVGIAALDYGRRDVLAYLMWMCNVSNLLLAAGLWTGRLRVVWVATMWLLVGVPVWGWEAWVSGRISGAHALFTHFGAAILGAYAIRRWRGAELPRWPVALATLFGLLVQGLTRLVTPENLNVNIAFRVHDAMTSSFASYSVYWVYSVLLTLIGLEITNRILARLHTSPDRSPISPDREG